MAAKINSCRLATEGYHSGCVSGIFRTFGSVQPDATGALLRIALPKPIEDPLAIGYASHFGLGLFAVDGGEAPASPFAQTKRST